MEATGVSKFLLIYVSMKVTIQVLDDDGIRLYLTNVSPKFAIDAMESFIVDEWTRVITNMNPVKEVEPSSERDEFINKVVDNFIFNKTNGSQESKEDQEEETN